MTRLDVALSDRLRHRGREYRFEGRRGGELDFRCDCDDGRLVLTDAALAEAVATGEAELVRGSPGPDGQPDVAARRVADFAARPAREKEEARRRLAYVQGALADGLAGKAGDADLGCSIAATAVRLGDADPPCARALRGWLARAGDRPSAARLLANHAGKGNRAPRLASEVAEAIEAEIDRRYLRRPPISLVALHGFVHAAVDRLNEGRVAKLDVPGYHAVRRAMLARPPREVHEARHGRASADRASALVRAAPKAAAPLDEVEIDHTLTDLFVVCARTALPIGRATVGLALDRCTRMPAGVHLGFDPPSVHTVLQLLRNTMLPKLYLDRKVEAGEWAIKHRWPVCGVPRKLILDRAMENLSADLDELGAEIGFDVAFAPRRRPQYKGAVENMLGKLNRRLLHEQRGTTFGNVLERGDYDPARNAVVTHDELLHVLHRWLLDVYACGSHRGIRDVPARRWAEMVERCPVNPVESIAQIDATLGRSRTATLSNKGIVFEHVRYGSDDLVALLADSAFRERAPDRRVRFRYDAGDLGTVRVHDPVADRYFEVPALDCDYARGLSIWQHRLIVTFENRRTNGAADFAGIARAKAEIADMFEAAWHGRRLKSRTRAARHDGVGRHAMAGASEATSPAGSVDAARRAAAGARAAVALAEARPAAESVGTERLLQPTPRTGTDDEEDEDIYARLGLAR